MCEMGEIYVQIIHDQHDGCEEGLYARRAEQEKKESQQEQNASKTHDHGYIVLEGNTTPSGLTSMIGLRFMLFDSGGKHPSTSVHLTSTYGDGSDPKKTVTGSAFAKFSPYTVSILEACGFGFARTARDCGQFDFGASEARSGGRYLTTPGKGVTGFDGIGNEPV